ncbi:MAG: hypothetical protein GX675_01210 [Erysipelotrichaceae bacterium]|nr:hypothetical protein [Erysipelotrichaceae bacterium]
MKKRKLRKPIRWTLMGILILVISILFNILMLVGISNQHHYINNGGGALEVFTE